MSLERMHTDASGVQGPRPGSGREWLNSVPVVDRMVRDFSREVIEKADGSPEFLSMVDFECRRMNGLFLGSSPSDKFDRGPWNAADQLGEYILKAMQINGETRMAVRDAFMVHAARLLQILRDAEGKPDGEFTKELERAVAALRSALLGLPVTM